MYSFGHSKSTRVQMQNRQFILNGLMGRNYTVHHSYVQTVATCLVLPANCLPGDSQMPHAKSDRCLAGASG